ncbi:uncharacterized protein LOC105261483 [Musca domestica]|uniref:Uncharacterized protein LOC105261483 n=1 Tax=Musca domestica TaxID=7370 RepID=A0A1I8NJP6_MUSDO|nr:uncharacterized protein LOC105261483 [Musca domestica]
MLKVICIFALVLVVSVHANRGCRPVCKPNVPSKAVCATDGKQQVCHRLSQCQLAEENCRRRLTNRPALSPVASGRCRNIKSPNRRGACAKVRRPRSTPKRDCNRLKCRNPDKTARCYRCRQNNCRLLNVCQAERANCLRNPLNRLSQTDRRQCAGMKPGQKPQRCRPVRKSG